MIKVTSHFVLVSSSMLGTNNVLIIEHRLLFFNLKRQLSFPYNKCIKYMYFELFVPYMFLKILYNNNRHDDDTCVTFHLVALVIGNALKRSSLGLTTCHVNIILVKKVFSTFLILPQWHLHYAYMPLGPKENLSHHGKIVPCDEYVNCFANYFFSWFPFVCFFMILSYGGDKLFMILFCFFGLLHWIQLLEVLPY